MSCYRIEKHLLSAMDFAAITLTPGAFFSLLSPCTEMGWAAPYRWHSSGYIRKQLHGPPHVLVSNLRLQDLLTLVFSTGILLIYLRVQI